MKSQNRNQLRASMALDSLKRRGRYPKRSRLLKKVQKYPEKYFKPTGKTFLESANNMFKFSYCGLESTIYTESNVLLERVYGGIE